jgi:hypothetical protein
MLRPSCLSLLSFFCLLSCSSYGCIYRSRNTMGTSLVKSHVWTIDLLNCFFLRVRYYWHRHSRTRKHIVLDRLFFLTNSSRYTPICTMSCNYQREIRGNCRTFRTVENTYGVLYIDFVFLEVINTYFLFHPECQCCHTLRNTCLVEYNSTRAMTTPMISSMSSNCEIT